MHPNADDIAGLAERLREKNNLAAALQLSTRVRAYAPDNRQAIQTEISTLANMGAAHQAYDLARQPGAHIDTSTRCRLRAEKTAADIRQALRERRWMEKHYRYAHRDDALISVLEDLNANLAAFPAGSRAYRRTKLDRIFVLNKLGRMQKVIAAYQDLKKQAAIIPGYTKRVVADAYATLRQPDKAARIYAKLLAAKKHPEAELSIGQYYALIDGEHYDQAAKLLAQLDRNTPDLQNRGRPNGRHEPNWERVEVDQLDVMDANYRNHSAVAEQRIAKLYADAPKNVDLINVYATILRWRGQPQRAQKLTELAAAYAPKAKSTRINLANNARDLGHFDEWRELILPLALDFPNDSTIQKSASALRDRNRPSISAQATVGRSNGGTAVNGSRDVKARSRLNSSWTSNGWRAFVDHYYRWASFGEGSARFNRPGIGGEWRWSRKHAWAEISDNKFTGNETGVLLGWSQWFNDQWQYQVAVDTYSPQTPLRAERAGLRGQLYQGQLTWQQNESRSATLNVGALDISDGNLRGMYSAQFSQRIQASAHHLTRAAVLIDAEHNSQPGGAYYNPENTTSVGATLEHDWITWRHYNRSFTQTFQIGVASDWESGYGAAPGIDLQYGHTWDISRTWSVQYGLGWASHEYDGAREHRLFGVIGFSGDF